MKDVIVLINGIDDVARHGHEALEKANSIRSGIISEVYPAATVKVFNFFPAKTSSSDLNEDNILDQAREVIVQLQEFNDTFVVDKKTLEWQDRPGIIFLAHGTGATLVKKILLLAYQQPSIQWLAIGTVSLHFIDSPAYYEPGQWQRYLGGLLVDEGIRLEWLHLPGIFNALPIAFSRVEHEFSIISAAFKTYHHQSERSYQNSNRPPRTLWDFDDEYPDYLDVLYRLQNEAQYCWNQHIKFISVPFASIQRHLLIDEPELGSLSPMLPIPTIIHRWLENEGGTVQSWMHSSDSDVLLITGPRGSNDKYLCRCIVSTLIQITKSEPSNSLILSFSFHHLDTRLNSERSLLSSLIQQLTILQREKRQTLTAAAVGLYAGGPPGIPTSAMWNLLTSLLQTGQAQQIFLVLHGVDQCLQPIATKIAGLPTTWKGLLQTRLKILMTCSACPQLPTSVNIRKVDLDSDGWRKVTSWMAEESLSRIIHRVPAWADAQQAILEKSYGNTHTHLQRMLNLEVLDRSNFPATTEAVETWLSKPVHSLDDMFQIMVSEVCDTVSAKNILGWIIYAVRPLTVQELAVAVALSSLFPDGDGLGSVTLEAFGSRISSNLMNNLEDAVKLMIRTDGGQVMLVHPTLRDYLKKHMFHLQPDFQASITRWFLLYFSLCCHIDPHNSSSGAALGRTTAFLDYSHRYWTRHYRKVNMPSEIIDQQVLSFLESDEQSRTFKAWITGYGTIPGKVREETDKITGDPLLFAIRLELPQIVQMLLGSSDLKLSKERLGDALVAVARSLDFKQASDLLALAPSDIDLRPAVCEAAAYGNTGGVELLRNRMGESWTGFTNPGPGETERHPLLLATLGGHTSTIEPLLKKGCSLLTAGPNGHTPVHIACRLGDIDALALMKRLQPEEFTKARHMTFEDKKNFNAFAMACRRGSLEVVDMLLMDEDEPLLQVEGTFMRLMDNGSPTYEILSAAAISGNLALAKRVFSASKVLLSYAFYPPIVALVFPVSITLQFKVFQLLVEEQLKEIQNMPPQPPSTDTESQGYVFPPDVKLTMMKNACQYVTRFPVRAWSNDLAVYICETLEDAPLDEQYRRHALEHGNVEFLEYCLSRDMPAGYDVRQQDGFKNWCRDVRLLLIIPSDNLDWAGCLRYLLKSLKKDEDAVRERLAEVRPKFIELFLISIQRNRKFCLRELFRELFASFHLTGAWVTILECAVTKGNLGCLKEVLNWKTEGFKSTTLLAEKIFRLAITRGRELEEKDVDSTLAKVRRDDPDRPERVRLLLSSGVITSSGGKDGVPPLHIAIEENTMDLVELLLKEGANPDNEKKPRQTSLHIAAQDERVEVLRLLLLHGGDPNHLDWEGQTVLHIAVQRESDEMVRLLLGPWMEDDRREGDVVDAKRRLFAQKREAARPTKELPDITRLVQPDVDMRIADDRRITPLILAAERGLVDIMNMLLLAGADPNLQDADCRTALYTVLDQRLLGGFHELLAFGADPNIYGGEFHSPLQCAIELDWDGWGNKFLMESSVQKVKVLLDYGADPNAQGGMYGSPLNAAIWNGSSEIIRVLITAGADSNIAATSLGCPLHHLVCSLNPGDCMHVDLGVQREILELILQEGGGDVDARNASGLTPMMVLLVKPKTFDVKIFKTLLNKSPDLNIQDNLGRTALHYVVLRLDRLLAMQNERPPLVEDLLKAGADPLARDSCGNTPLYYFIYAFQIPASDHYGTAAISEKRWEELFDTLLEAIPVADRPRILSEALLAAVKLGLERPVNRILAEHAKGNMLDFSLVDRSGYTALDITEFHIGNLAPEIVSAATVQKLRDLGAVHTPISSRKAPTRWSEHDKHIDLLLSEDGMEVFFDRRCLTCCFRVAPVYMAT
ncbi:hypothetical protein B0T20DRAFT_406670 [Sordaria brevicollis]|uniref:Nephrocystin 3-like N-terminal domain-containing protein n=1 Tax=Sordaria brevicollis TaxID=83679 RepID=A0AAE0PGQ5_SORBR|nr:hypothetical protein B0T20DRAFT_406670 [Sordaria brevicollis]